jgi:hypothetical protein
MKTFDLTPEGLQAGNDWYSTVQDRIETAVIFLASAIREIQRVDQDGELNMFRPSDDAVLRAAVEICNIVFGNKDVEW